MVGFVPLGSPPQVRGKLCQCGLRRPRSRITPAGAGKTLVALEIFSAGWDHPRRCGENPCRNDIHELHIGSPPQVRGKRTEFQTGAVRDRITPAGAGKTSGWKFAKTVCWDHPRRCGENAFYTHGVPQSWGSPPQVRGKLHIRAMSQSDSGITPAGAGKTDFPITHRSFSRDHPRRCGENSVVDDAMKAMNGSPPQVRGKPSENCIPTVGAGITPAGAGKTSESRYSSLGTEDHPRRCGENTKKIL